MSCHLAQIAKGFNVVAHIGFTPTDRQTADLATKYYEGLITNINSSKWRHGDASKLIPLLDSKTTFLTAYDGELLWVLRFLSKWRLSKWIFVQVQIVQVNIVQVTLLSKCHYCPSEHCPSVIFVQVSILSKWHFCPSDIFVQVTFLSLGPSFHQQLCCVRPMLP